MGELAKVLAQTRSSPRLTAAEDKVSEQITASATRLERVADDESSKEQQGSVHLETPTAARACHGCPPRGARPPVSGAHRDDVGGGC